MNFRVPLLLVTFAATSCAMGAGVELELRTAKAQQVVFEPADFRLVLLNRGSESVSVAPSSDGTDRLRIEREGGWAECRSILSITPGVGPRDWQRVAPGGELELRLRSFSCPGTGEASNTRPKDWTEVPGRYRFQVEYQLSTNADVGGADTTPPGAFGGTLTSNTVTVEVKGATGVDAEALRWAAEHQHNPLDVEVANRFPSSSYGAIVLSRYVSPALPEPEKVRALLAAGSFPSERSVPDASAPDGWISLSGRELAQWQIETGERILGQQPGFAYARRLRLAIALAYTSVGKNERGERDLRTLGKENSSAEGRWAARYLALGS